MRLSTFLSLGWPKTLHYPESPAIVWTTPCALFDKPRFFHHSFLWLASMSHDLQISPCRKRKHGRTSFYSGCKMPILKLVWPLKCVLMSFDARNMSCYFRLCVQWMYMIFSLLVITKKLRPTFSLLPRWLLGTLLSILFLLCCVTV